LNFNVGLVEVFRSKELIHPSNVGIGFVDGKGDFLFSNRLKKDHPKKDPTPYFR
jgi:hypothetical protein